MEDVARQPQMAYEAAAVRRRTRTIAMMRWSLQVGTRGGSNGRREIGKAEDAVGWNTRDRCMDLLFKHTHTGRMMNNETHTHAHNNGEHDGNARCNGRTLKTKRSSCRSRPSTAQHSTDATTAVPPATTEWCPPCSDYTDSMETPGAALRCDSSVGGSAMVRGEERWAMSEDRRGQQCSAVHYS